MNDYTVSTESFGALTLTIDYDASAESPLGMWDTPIKIINLGKDRYNDSVQNAKLADYGIYDEGYYFRESEQGERIEFDDVEDAIAWLRKNTPHEYMQGTLRGYSQGDWMDYLAVYERDDIAWEISAYNRKNFKIEYKSMKDEKSYYVTDRADKMYRDDHEWWLTPEHARVRVAKLLRVTKQDREKAQEYMKGFMNEMNSYFAGDVYGYTITDDTGYDVDSCWGFFGSDSINDATKDAIDYYLTLPQYAAGAEEPYDVGEYKH